MSIAVILGSAFSNAQLGPYALTAQQVRTPWGDVELHSCPIPNRDCHVIIRHGAPHRYLPNQIPYRAHTYALRKLGCQALLVTSSVGVLDLAVPLDRPMLVSDLLMPENRLPDGSACSMFPEPEAQHGHLVLEGGLFDGQLNAQMHRYFRSQWDEAAQEVVFAYAGGPRTKTPAENVFWRKMGAQVNSMTLGPEVVLANEYEIPTAALVVGHKYSNPDAKDPLDQDSITASLERGHKAFVDAVLHFLTHIQPVPFGNRIYRFER